MNTANRKGGVNGHPVKLIVYDDGGDPARHKAAVQEAVEQRKVIALLQEADPFTHQVAVEYLNAKRVPVIGTSLSNPWDYTSPMHFPQSTGGKYSFATVIYRAAVDMVPAQKTKLGTLVCVETPTCNQVDDVATEVGKQVGFDKVYQAKASLGQPDFTAECLSAESAGVQLLFVALDSNSLGRVAASCARQGYLPAFTVIPPAMLDRLKDDPNLSNMIAATSAFPYFASGSPATDEFQSAVKRYGGQITLGWGTAAGWVSGKLFETAAAKLGEPATSAELLKGLWAIHENDLGGLTVPLTFTEGRPATPSVCWWNLRVRDKKWISDGGRRCVPPPNL